MVVKDYSVIHDFIIVTDFMVVKDFMVVNKCIFLERNKTSVNEQTFRF